MSHVKQGFSCQPGNSRLNSGGYYGYRRCGKDYQGPQETPDGEVRGKAEDFTHQ